jgi:hypothetical protein
VAIRLGVPRDELVALYVGWLVCDHELDTVALAVAVGVAVALAVALPLGDHSGVWLTQAPVLRLAVADAPGELELAEETDADAVGDNDGDALPSGPP